MGQTQIEILGSTFSRSKSRVCRQQLKNMQGSVHFADILS